MPSGRWRCGPPIPLARSVTEKFSQRGVDLTSVFQLRKRRHQPWRLRAPLKRKYRTGRRELRRAKTGERTKDQFRTERIGPAELRSRETPISVVVKTFVNHPGFTIGFSERRNRFGNLPGTRCCQRATDDPERPH